MRGVPVPLPLFILSTITLLGVFSQLKPVVSHQFDCPRVHAPVCGDDGVTYWNECILKFIKALVNPKLKKVHDGPCKNGPIDAMDNLVGFRRECPQYYSPVCGSDGVDYWNGCYLELEKSERKPNLWKVYDGACNNDWIRS